MSQTGVVSVVSDSNISNGGLMVAQAVKITLPGDLTNEQGMIEVQNGGLLISGANNEEAEKIVNKAGLITTDSASGNLVINATSLENLYDGTMSEKMKIRSWQMH